MQPKKTVEISVDLSDYRAHLFKITMLLSGALQNQKLSLPVWTPGSYMVREFAQHIISLKAYENDQVITQKKINKNTFELGNCSDNVLVYYQVYGFDSSIRAAFIDNEQAFFNGTALFLRPHGLDDAQYSLKLILPKEKLFDWQIATAMTPTNSNNKAIKTYQAESYEELVDYPFQVSDMKRLEFTVCNVFFEMVLVGDIRVFDESRLVRDLKNLLENQTQFFGGLAPFSKYLFIARFEEGGHGGLEHRNSAMLLASPYSLPKIGLEEPDSNYRNFLSLCSHEYFHAWNIKRLKPHNFLKLDFDNEVYTTMLWIFEGVTSYYDDLLVRRAGLIPVKQYLDLLGKNYSKLLRNQGRFVQSVAEASFDAWIKFYRQNENSPNVLVSYYLNGAFIALYLDLLIRIKSNHEISLDDIIHIAFEKFGNNRNFHEEDFFVLLKDLGKIDADKIKKDHIYGAHELPLKEILENFGINLWLEPDDTYIEDKIKMSTFLGVKLRFDDKNGVIISFVEKDGPFMLSGMSPGDEILAINNIRLDSSNISDLLASLKTGEAVEILFVRKKIVRKSQILPIELPKRACKFLLKENMDHKAKQCLEKWLGALE
jgi:predicted metalloprotease with PDZ domain